MTTKNVWMAGLAAPVMIAMLLLAGAPSVTANDQSSAANAEVKIEFQLWAADAYGTRRSDSYLDQP